MYIAKKEGFGGSWQYFQDNDNDSPKWTTDKSEARLFANKHEAMKRSNKSGLYSIILESVDGTSAN